MPIRLFIRSESFRLAMARARVGRSLAWKTLSSESAGVNARFAWTSETPAVDTAGVSGNSWHRSGGLVTVGVLLHHQGGDDVENDTGPETCAENQDAEKYAEPKGAEVEMFRDASNDTGKHAVA